MLARRIHSVIATGLKDPSRLELWQREPELLSKCGVDPDKFDLNVLKKFAGLAAKVRHNGLRADFPLTFRLLNVAGLEIEVFAAYASFHSSKGFRFADTSDARALDLLAFLEQWLDFERRDHVLLLDMFRYERAISHLGKVASVASSPPEAKPVSEVATDLRVCGDVILLDMHCDPRSVGPILYQESPRLDEVVLGTFQFCYWRKSGTKEINVLQLDALGFYLLSLADEKRSMADMNRIIGTDRSLAEGFQNALAEFAAIGILAFDSGQERTL